MYGVQSYLQLHILVSGEPLPEQDAELPSLVVIREMGLHGFL